MLKVNPAGKRSLTLTQTLESTWLNKPTWIKHEEDWPKKLNIKNVEVEGLIKETCNNVTIIKQLADWHKFSNFKRLQNTLSTFWEQYRKRNQNIEYNSCRETAS